MSEPRRNVECKAHDPDPERSLAICRSLDAEDRGVIWQRDTYFQVSSGRLKLREQRPGEDHLIQYDRADSARARESDYRIVKVDDAEAMVAALGAALGIRATVTKRRHLFLWGPVRIHLDDVEGQGRFVELEAVASPGSDLVKEAGMVAELRERLGVTDDRLIATGYADLAIAPAGAIAEATAVVITGPPGAGKTSVLERLSTLLEIDGLAFGAIESEQLGWGSPRLDDGQVARQLGAVLKLQRAAGRNLFLIAATLESEAALAELVGTIAARRTAVVLLEAPADLVAARIDQREPDDWPGKAWLIKHARMLAASMANLQAIDVRISTADRQPTAVAIEVRSQLRALGFVI